jgi:hypothetical protein
MIIFLNLHSGTKLSGWLRHWLFGAKAQKKRKLILGIELGQLALANSLSSLSRHRSNLVPRACDPREGTQARGTRLAQEKISHSEVDERTGDEC